MWIQQHIQTYDPTTCIVQGNKSFKSRDWRIREVNAQLWKFYPI